MELIYRQFFSLLRAGLWGTQIDSEFFHGTDVNWETLYRLSKEQTVLGIIFDGLEFVPAHSRPTRDMLFKWYAQVNYIAGLNQKTNQVINEIQSQYNQRGLHPILLKGQGTASLYKNPLRRQCGDVDLLIGEKKYQIANAIIKGMSSNDGLYSDKHFNIKYNGICIENHREAAVLNTKRRREVFKRITDEWFPNSNTNATIGLYSIPVPPPKYNIIYTFIHILYHFLSEGIGARQLCDWSILINHYRHEVNWREIYAIIVELQMEDAWAVFQSFCVTYMGLSQDGLLAVKNSNKTDKLASFIIRYGNFGHSDPLKNNKLTDYWEKKALSLRRHVRRTSEIFPILPLEAFRYLYLKIPEGLKQIIVDKKD